MSKIGRKPIRVEGIQVEIKGQDIHYKGSKDAGIYSLPDFLRADLKDNEIKLSIKEGSGKLNKFWGMHRALLANKLLGASKDFEQVIKITGLGYKGELTGNKLRFSLGYSHKIDFDIPKGVAAQVDKSGQIITLRSPDKALLGEVCSKIKALRPTEPYKGTGIKLDKEVIRRKAGKAKTTTG